MFRYHTTVQSGLQISARLARSSPIMAVVQVSDAKAEAVAGRLLKRYPTIALSHVSRTALRKINAPVTQLVILPPKQQQVTMLLMSDAVPDQREQWFDGTEPDTPLIWRNYQLHHNEKGRMTWRLSGAARTYYQDRIARLISGRGGSVPVLNGEGKQVGQRPVYRPSPEAARLQLQQLAVHMSRYPGLSGIRADIATLAQYSNRIWKSTYDVPCPEWPTMPYTRFLAARTAPLVDVIHYQNGATDAQTEETAELE